MPLCCRDLFADGATAVTSAIVFNENQALHRSQWSQRSRHSRPVSAFNALRRVERRASPSCSHEPRAHTAEMIGLRVQSDKG
jgi:hypothetical protein